MKRLETHYGQQLETLQRMHVDKCESILCEIDNLRKTNEAFRKQLQRNGIEPGIFFFFFKSYVYIVLPRSGLGYL